MLFFYFSSGSGDSYSVGPLIGLLPVLLTFAPILFQEIISLVQLTSTSSRRPLSNLDTIGQLVEFAISLVISAIGVWGMIRFVRWVRLNGGWKFLFRLLLQGYQAGPIPAAGDRRAQTNRGQPRRATVDEIAEALSKLPTETYKTPEQLAALPVHELKELLHGRGLKPPAQCLEKQELVRLLLDHGGSSADSCSICCEEYAAQAQQAGTGTAADTEETPVVLRVLRCGHRFHVECVDKWFLSSTDYTRAPACPLCNAPLLQQQPHGQR